MRWRWIDMARGVAVFWMILDHASLFLNPGRMAGRGLLGEFPPIPDTTNFLLRFIMVPMPGFLFISGVMIGRAAHAIGTGQGDAWTLRRKLMIRGMVLLALDIIVISPLSQLGHGAFAQLTAVTFQILSCFGGLFLIYAMIFQWPAHIHLLLACLAAVGREVVQLPPVDIANWETIGRGLLWDAIGHDGVWMGVYPVLCWLPCLAFGHFLGGLNARRMAAGRPQLSARAYLWMGIAMVAAFVCLRGMTDFGFLGEPRPQDWQAFLSPRKYPPSIHFHLLGGGTALFYFALCRRFEDRPELAWTRFLAIQGRHPLTSYMLHLLLICPLAGLTPLRDAFGSIALACLTWVGVLAILIRLLAWKERRSPPAPPYARGL